MVVVSSANLLSLPHTQRERLINYPADSVYRKVSQVGCGRLVLLTHSSFSAPVCLKPCLSFQLYPHRILQLQALSCSLLLFHCSLTSCQLHPTVSPSGHLHCTPPTFTLYTYSITSNGCQVHKHTPKPCQLLVLLHSRTFRGGGVTE